MKEFTLTKLSLFFLFLHTVFVKITFNETVGFIADNISIISFVIVLVANWGKIKEQVRKWAIKITKK